MIPDLETVLRRRHIVIIFIRIAAIMTILWWAVPILEELLYGVLTLNITQATWNFAPRLASGIVAIALASGMLILQRGLAAMLVPMGRRVDSCLNCGYSLKNLRTNVCPECGSPTLKHSTSSQSGSGRSVHSPPAPPPLASSTPPTPPPPPGFPRS